MNDRLTIATAILAAIHTRGATDAAAQAKVALKAADALIAAEAAK